MIDGPRIRAQSQIRLAVNRYFNNEKNKSEIKISSVKQKKITLQKLFDEIQIYLLANPKKYPDIKITDIKSDSLIRGDRKIPDKLVPLLYSFFYNSSPSNHKIISRSHNEIIRTPYSDTEMGGLEEGIFKVMRYSTTKKGLNTKKKYPGMVSVSWLNIWKEPFDGSDCSYWHYEQIKVMRDKNEPYKESMRTLYTEGIIKKNYGQYLFIGAEQYTRNNKEETGTQIMFIDNDNDSENLRGLLMTTTFYGDTPAATRVFIKKSPDMRPQETYIDVNSKDTRYFIENYIDKDWHMLLPPSKR